LVISKYGDGRYKTADVLHRVGARTLDKNSDEPISVELPIMDKASLKALKTNDSNVTALASRGKAGRCRFE
jgi:hypothetical protein